MANLKTLSTRIDQEGLYYVDKISKMFNIDRSTALRDLLHKGIQIDKKERALDLYSKGKLSIESAAKFADVYIGEFLELLKERGIELNVSVEDYEQGLKNLRKVWK